MPDIMFIHHSGAAGGAGVSLMNNVSLLSQSNEVTVYIPSEPDYIRNLLYAGCPDAEIIEYGKRIGALTYYSGGDSVWSARFIYRMLLIIRQFRYWNKEIESRSPDIILINSKILSWMSLLPAVRKHKSILFVRETTQGSPKRVINRIIRTNLNRFSTVVFLSEYDRKSENLTTASTAVIKNSINRKQLRSGMTREQALAELKLPADAFYALYVGGVNEMKGFDIALQSVLKAGKEFHLLAVGNDFNQAMDTKSATARQYAVQWKDYIEHHDANNQIHILGRQPDMTALYAGCDVLLFPMRSPHQARPVFEAGYYKKPVIITDFECISEFVEDGVNGFTVPADSVDAISDKLLLLKFNKDMADSMGQKNFELTEKNHNADANYAKLCNIIKETMA